MKEDELKRLELSVQFYLMLVMAKLLEIRSVKALISSFR